MPGPDASTWPPLPTCPELPLPRPVERRQAASLERGEAELDTTMDQRPQRGQGEVGGDRDFAPKGHLAMSRDVFGCHN